MHRWWVISVSVLATTVFLSSCGETASRNCSKDFADAYNETNVYLYVYSKVTMRDGDFEFRKQEAEKVCKNFESRYGDILCMADKNGKFTQVSGSDWSQPCAAVKAGRSIQIDQ